MMNQSQQIELIWWATVVILGVIFGFVIFGGA
jgi:hypothetical protein